MATLNGRLPLIGLIVTVFAWIGPFQPFLPSPIELLAGFVTPRDSHHDRDGHGATPELAREADAMGDRPPCDVPTQETGVGNERAIRVVVPGGCVAIIDAEWVAGYDEHGVIVAIRGPWESALRVKTGAVVVVRERFARDVYCERLRYVVDHGYASERRTLLPEWQPCW